MLHVSQPSLIFLGRKSSLIIECDTDWCFTQLGTGLFTQMLDKPKKLPIGKHASLFFISCSENENLFLKDRVKGTTETEPDIS